MMQLFMNLLSIYVYVFCAAFQNGDDIMQKEIMFHEFKLKVTIFVKKKQMKPPKSIAVYKGHTFNGFVSSVAQGCVLQM